MGQTKSKTMYSESRGAGVVGFWNIAAHLYNGNEIRRDACLYQRKKSIEYGTSTNHKDSNLCTHTVVSTVSGIPANRASFGTWSVHGVNPGDPTYDPTAELEPSRPMFISPNGEVTLDEGPVLKKLSRNLFNAESEVLAGGRPDEHMNALQSVCELKDTKETLDGLTKFYQWTKRMVSAGKKVPGVGKKLSLTSSLASCAGAYLWYAFGVKPTASDVKQFCEELSAGKLKVSGQLAKQYRKGDIVKARFYAAPDKEDIASAMYGSRPLRWHETGITGMFSGSSWYPILPSNPIWAKTVKAKVFRGCLYAVVTRDFTVSDREQLAKRFLWNCPVGGTMWELLPFSFLVDWFIDVGSYIKALDRRHTMQNFRTYLSPIWQCLRTEMVTYKPALLRYDTTVSGVHRVGLYGASFNWTLDYELGYRAESKDVGFSRHPYTSKPLYTAEFKLPVKSYQISSGMALLAQAVFG